MLAVIILKKSVTLEITEVFIERDNDKISDTFNEIAAKVLSEYACEKQEVDK